MSEAPISHNSGHNNAQSSSGDGNGDDNGRDTGIDSGAVEGSVLPPVSLLRSRIESLLLVSDEPVSVTALARILGAVADQADTGSARSDDALAGHIAPTESQIAGVLEGISLEYDSRGCGFDLRETAEGWRLYTRRANSEVVEAKLLDGTQQRLSRAALETLAVVAYRQPVTRAQVAAVRGVNCDGVMRTLALRGLITEVGTTGEVGGANLYATTELFLEQLGMNSLDELPDLAPLLPDVESIDIDQA